MLRANAEHQRLTGAEHARRRGQREAVLTVVDLHHQRRRVAAFHFSRQEVHLGRADKASDKTIHRVVIEFHRRTHLFDLTVIHHHDFVGQRHRFYLIVRHINHGGFQLLMQFGDVQAHIDAQFGIQVRKRLIKHKHPRITHDGATNRHALALSTGELFRFAIQQVRQLQGFRHHLHLMANLIFCHAVDLQAIAHVLRHRHVRIERIGLKHHCYAAV